MRIPLSPSHLTTPEGVCIRCQQPTEKGCYCQTCRENHSKGSYGKPIAAPAEGPFEYLERG